MCSVLINMSYNPLPDINKERLLDEFANYFLNMIEKIMDIFDGNVKYSPPIRPCAKLLNLNLSQKNMY